jgi:riboflavin kinase/FMN adenylyltransferase
VVNIGSRPTVSGKDDRLEVHLLNFTDDIYGHHLHVDLLFKLREEKRFESLDALKHQIHRDIAMARDFL